MVVPIPYARTYFSDLTGSALVLTTCENCQSQYVYRMERTASGKATSWLFLNEGGARKRAMHTAETDLQLKLAREFDAVPYPQCGFYQSYMQTMVRKDYQRWIRVIGQVALVVGGILMLVYLLTSLSDSLTAKRLRLMSDCLFGAAISGAIAVGMLVTKLVISRRFDPNDPADADRRIRLGKSRAIPKDYLESITGESQSEA